MGNDVKSPVTPAIRVLREAGVSYREHQYTYVPKGGTASTTAALGVPEHEVVKTLVFEDDSGKPFIVLMHGDRSVSTKELARQLGVKRTAPCTPEKSRPCRPELTSRCAHREVSSGLSDLPGLAGNGQSRKIRQRPARRRSQCSSSQTSGSATGPRAKSRRSAAGTFAMPSTRIDSQRAARAMGRASSSRSSSGVSSW